MKVDGTIRLNAYAIIADAVELGIERGWNHAHKHTETPTREQLIMCIYDDIMNSLSEILEFDHEA